MTMQDGSPGFSDITWADLRPDLIARLQASMGHASPPHRDEPDSRHHALLAGLGLTHLTQIGIRPGETVPTAEALLLFGTEEAIGRHFPLLKTRVSLRDLVRNREKAVDLPGNIPECLEALGRFVAAELPAKDDHASLRDTAILPWLFEMAISRDYTQTRVARLVRDRDHVFLEYPRRIAFDDAPATPSAVRYVRSEPIQAVLSRLYPTMQAESVEVEGTVTAAPARELAYFGTAPLRIEGRFFKIMATIPYPDLHGHPPGGTAGQAATGHHEASPAASATPHPRHRGKASKAALKIMQGTMQAWRAAVATFGSWLLPKPGSPVTLAAVQVPARSPASTPSLGAGATPAVPSRPAPHPVSTHQPPKTLPPVFHSQPAETAFPKRKRSVDSRAPGPRTERADASERVARILDFCSTPRHRDEIQKLVGMNNRDHFRKEVLNRLIAQGLLAPTLPDKPNSPKQQYVTRTAATASMGRPVES